MSSDTVEQMNVNCNLSSVINLIEVVAGSEET